MVTFGYAFTRDKEIIMPRNLLLPLTTLLSCWILVSSPALTAETRTFGDYWYQGQAELTSYDLEQARYGEVHRGHAVLIFVTEDFSKSKQVKLDDPGAAGDDRTKVMKLNFTKSFTTGIYPYSMMTSVFTPVDLSPTLKVTTSSQEWCGHTFTQLNRTSAGYRVTQLSYFESEGDETLELDAAVAEDGLWTLIRIDPSALPTGRLRLIPGTMFQRLRHQPWRLSEADATLAPDPSDPALTAYTLDYPELGRTLTIRFRSAFPHEIESWEESYVSGWGEGATRLVTRGVAKKRMLLDYWNHHDLKDAPLRDQLGLD